jgi:hypothetical protein
MSRTRIFFTQVLGPLLLAGLIYWLTEWLIWHDGSFDMLRAWMIVGLPFGFHAMAFKLIPISGDPAFCVFIIMIDLIIAGLLGGLVLIWKVVSGLFKTIVGEI